MTKLLSVCLAKQTSANNLIESLVLVRQLINLVKFCEVAVAKCRNLKFINVTTVEDNKTDQKTAFAALTKDLATRNITLDIEYSNQLHDRQIM